VHVDAYSDWLPSGDAPADLVSSTALLDQKVYRELETYVAIGVGAFEKKRNGTPSPQLRVVCHLRAHAPAEEIAQLAADLQADLVVVGVHGRGAVARFFLGSVAEAVTRLAPCPVLVFRAKGLPAEYPKIEPPCPRCVDARVASDGAQFWCEQHRERHGQRHFYDQTDRMSQSINMPLVGNTPPHV
jgi:nucleotide-binding universal stress UspA family protein